MADILNPYPLHGEGDSLVQERAGVFVLWLREASAKAPQLAGVLNAMREVGVKALDGDDLPEEVQAYVAGCMRGWAKAAGYVEDYDTQARLYLSYALAAVVEGDDGDS